jgi:SAM-dependent methyltransferase
MDHREVGRLWNENAKTWAPLVQQGYDVYRDHLNTPSFLRMLPDVRGQLGLDIGCGEGSNTRELARRGARMVGIDIAEVFLSYAVETPTFDERSNHGASSVESGGEISYQHASAVELPFKSRAFDFATAFMSLMDIPESDEAVREAHRVLKPGGFLQFSILHPCFSTVRWKWVTDEDGERIGVVCGDYFTRTQGRIEEWTFGGAPDELKRTLPKFRIPRFFHTLSEWLNLLVDTGFHVEHCVEPTADEETARRHPYVSDTRIVPLFLIMRCRKPA